MPIEAQDTKETVANVCRSRTITSSKCKVIIVIMQPFQKCYAEPYKWLPLPFQKFSAEILHEAMAVELQRSGSNK